jgi:hypothetical protein
MANEQVPPSKGESQNAGKANTSGTVTNAREATGSVIKETVAKSEKSDGQLTFEGLGDLSVPIEELDINIEDPNSGEGEYVVMMHEYVSGVNKVYKKGDVRKLSKLLANYGVEEFVKDVRASAKRLVDLGAIRLATKEEQGKVWVEAGENSDAVALERSKRIQLERELDTLKRQSLDKNFVDPKKGVEANWE